VSVAPTIEFRVDDLSGEAIRALIAQHLSAMHSYSPPESVHALDLGALHKPEITFWTGWIDGELACMGALKRLDAVRGEIKSMRATDKWMGKGVGRAMLDHIISEARSVGLKSLWLETGTPDPFWPARRLYERAGLLRAFRGLCPRSHERVHDAGDLRAGGQISGACREAGVRGPLSGGMRDGAG
jgi:putative acetyltransferase